MEIKRIDLEDERPVTVVAEMTISELAFMTKMTGKLSPLTAEEAVPGHGPSSSGIYSGGTHIFSRFWDDGVDGYLRGDEE